MYEYVCIDTPKRDIIKLENIRQSYDNGKTYIIDGLDFLIEDKENQGEFVVILGKSGCGKSTLLKYITGLQTPTEGNVYIDGELKDRKKNISMVFQQYSSLPWLSVLENVELGLKFNGIKDKKKIKEQALYFLNEVNLYGCENKYPGQLSGGQRQRVAIARSLIANPKIVLMDEPFGALDIHTRLEMQTLLADIWLKYNTTIIFVTHDIAEAAFLGDDVYVMSNNPGKIVKHLHVPLPLERKPEIKRTTEFQNIVNTIEDLVYTS